jgi:hypothetical protein
VTVVKEAQRLRELEKEHARLKRLLAERDLEIDCLKEVASKNRVPVCGWQRSPEKEGSPTSGRDGPVFGTACLSPRRCVPLGGSLSEATKTGGRALSGGATERVCQEAEAARIPLGASGDATRGVGGQPQAHLTHASMGTRLWKREGLTVPPRRTRKWIRNVAPPRNVTAARPDAVWCLDFLEERTLVGKKLRILCVTDEFTRESLAIEVGHSFKSERVSPTPWVPGVGRFVRLSRSARCLAHGQWARVHRAGVAGFVPSSRRRDRLHSAWQTVGEWIRGEFRVSVARRVPGWRDSVIRAGEASAPIGLPPVLERRTSAFNPGLPDSTRVRGTMDRRSHTVGEPGRGQRAEW